MPVELVPRTADIYDRQMGQLDRDGHRDGASDLGNVGQVTDHPHEVTEDGREWGRCCFCGLGEAAHTRSVGWIPF